MRSYQGTTETMSFISNLFLCKKKIIFTLLLGVTNGMMSFTLQKMTKLFGQWPTKNGFCITPTEKCGNDTDISFQLPKKDNFQWHAITGVHPQILKGRCHKKVPLYSDCKHLFFCNVYISSHKPFNNTDITQQKTCLQERSLDTPK